MRCYAAVVLRRVGPGPYGFIRVDGVGQVYIRGLSAFSCKAKAGPREAEHRKDANQVGRCTDEDLVREHHLREVDKEQDGMGKARSAVEVQGAGAPSRCVAGDRHRGCNAQEEGFVLLGILQQRAAGQERRRA